MAETFDPDTYDMNAELERYGESLVEGYNKYDWDWGETEQEVTAEFYKRIEGWREYKEHHLETCRSNMAEIAKLTEQYSYRYPDITEDNWQQFSYLKKPTVLIDDFPALILGVESGPIEFHSHCPYDPRLWWSQTGGYACHHPMLHGVLLPLSDFGYRAASEIAKKWLDSLIAPYDTGLWGGPTLDQLMEYSNDLTEWNLSCNYTYKDFHEAWYPVDLTCLPLLVDTDIEDNSYEAVEEWITNNIAPGPPEPYLGSYRWKLVICGENCD